MYGLEKEKKERFAFDLEKELKAKPARKKELLEHAETTIHNLKKKLREGANEKEFDRLGVLLQGYTALQKVLKKAAK
jgi:hypothetical protein